VGGLAYAHLSFFAFFDFFFVLTQVVDYDEIECITLLFTSNVDQDEAA